MQVIEKFLAELATQLKEKNATVTLTDAAKKWLYKKGYDPAYGARPMARTIDEHINKPMVDQLLFGDLAKGGKVTIDVKGEELTFNYSKITP